MHLSIVYVFTLSTLYVSTTNGAEFLAVFPIPAKSHHHVFQPIITALADKGHRVTYVTPVPLKKDHPNVKQILIPDSYTEINKHIGISQSENDWADPIRAHSAIILREIGLFVCEFTFKQEKFQEILKSTSLRFDAILLETGFSQEPLVALSHKFNAPVIDIMPSGNFLWTYWTHGNPYDPSYIVDVGVPFTDEMTFFERLQNTVNSILIRTLWSLYYIPKYEQLMSKYARYPGWETRPSMMEMINGRVALILENAHYSLSAPYPLSPNFKNIAGVNLLPPNPLPKDLQAFMDESEEGVIYFTLGSHLPASTILGDRVRDELIKAFSKVKQRVLWKWETEIPQASKNVKVSKWFPQIDVLAHKNVKMFISHGGFLSITEAVHFGIPVVGIPILGDQPKNVKNVVKFGYGIYLDPMNITEASVTWAIHEVLSNRKYKENALKASQILKDRPEPPIETALYWIEYVLRYKGAPHLRPAVTKLAWYQESLLDVYLALAVIICTPLYLIYFILNSILKCCSMLFGRGKRKTDVNKKRK